jgi:hypothetical protein
MARSTRSLFCWILDESDNPFSVQLDGSMTVDQLKAAIVEIKHITFENVKRDKIKLWKVRDFRKIMAIPVLTAQRTGTRGA